MRENKQISQTTNPSVNMNTITDYLNLPFIEVLKHLMKDAVKDYLAESGVPATIVSASAKSKERDPEGLNVTEALEFLNENGYPMKIGQLYTAIQGNEQRHHPSLEIQQQASFQGDRAFELG